MRTFLCLVFLAIGPDMLLSRLAPTWLARLAFRRVPVTRRFVLPRAPRTRADRPAYREDARPHGAGEIPRLRDAIELGHGRIVPDGPRTFVLAASPERALRFVVRIDAHEERGEIVLRARQAPPFVLLPLGAMAGVAWLWIENPGREASVVIIGALTLVLPLGIHLLDTTQRDLRTAGAMQLIEAEMRAARRAEASEQAATTG